MNLVMSVHFLLVRNLTACARHGIYSDMEPAMKYVQVDLLAKTQIHDGRKTGEIDWKHTAESVSRRFGIDK